MSLTPVTYTPPTAPAGYSWEATDEEVAARYGVPLERILRFDLNTSPAPPTLVDDVLRAGRFVTPLSEYPPSDYRRLVEAAAARYGVGTDELLVGAGADEILDLAGKAFLPPGGVAVIPTPSYAMYRVITEQRGATVADVPRRPGAGGFALDPDAVRAAARTASLVWLCSPNNPTGLPEPDGAIAALLDDLAADAAADGRPAPAVVLDEAYAEFVGRSLADLRFTYPRLVSVRTASKAYAVAGLRVGFAVARPETIALIAPYRPPGSVSTVSVTVVTELLRDDDAYRANVERVERERDRFAAALRTVGWTVWPSVTNFLLVGLGSRERAARVGEGLLRRGLVPRTFGAAHPLADHLRLTIRDRADNERFATAAAEIEAEIGADISAETVP
ncbi:MAG TPA: histidinol-phosphate transaminase [Candidatus Limnocylindrales bacterium]|nr:histidinol-phosphate transaminase [Candidatus Limnocylindrales bacterium]